MFDDLHSDGPGEGRGRARENGQPERPLADREVPLGPPSATIADAVHAWLDGEAPESSVRRGEWSREVEFWKKLDEDLAARRRLKTPAHLQAQIMNALPMHAPQLITPWWRREFVVTPQSAMLAAATLVAVAAATTVLLLRLPH
jgi:hypothetical protein